MAYTQLNQLKCFSCSKIPTGQIFECRRDNRTFCNDCQENMDNCSECGFELHRNPKLEVAVAMVVLECQFKKKGCQQKLLLKDFEYHDQTCIFGGQSVKFCKFLGYNCDNVMNTREIDLFARHAHQTHGFESITGNYFRISVKNFASYKPHRKIIWTPVIINLENEDVQLVIVPYAVNGALSVNCFSTKEVPDNFLASIRIGDNAENIPAIRWIVKPTFIAHADQIIRFPQLMNFSDVLFQHYLKNETLDIYMFVHGEDFPADPPEEKSSIEIENFHEIQSFSEGFSRFSFTPFLYGTGFGCLLASFALYHAKK